MPYTRAEYNRINEFIDFIIRNGIDSVSPLIIAQHYRKMMIGIEDWKDSLRNENRKAYALVDVVSAV